EGELKGGLRLDHRQGVYQGGDSGPAVKPGDVEGSLLLQAIRYESLEMPPKGKLPDAVIQDFERWIRRGAAYPVDRDAPAPNDARSEPSALQAAPSDLASPTDHWAYRPLVRPPVPPRSTTESRAACAVVEANAI